MLYREHATARWIAPLVVAVALLRGGPARAEDHVDELTTTLASSSSDKARLAAVVALARLADRRTMKPLVGALSDPSAEVRAVAAMALGKLGHKAALPALRTRAADDGDEHVRDLAGAAATTIEKANNLPGPVGSGDAAAKSTRPARRVGKAGFGNNPPALEPQPDLYLLVNSANDDSPGKADRTTRKVHAEIVKQALVDQCKSNPLVTTAAGAAQRLGLDSRRHIDVSVTKLEVAVVGTLIEVEAQLRLAISDDKGKMLSFLSGGAKVQVPKRKFNPRYLVNLRREALESAAQGMFDKLLAHLRDRSQT